MGLLDSKVVKPNKSINKHCAITKHRWTCFESSQNRAEISL